MQPRELFGFAVTFVVVSVAVWGIVGLGASAGLTTAAGPLADAGLDQTVTENETVYLDAGGSVAPDGTIEEYEWEIETPTGTETAPDCEDCVRTSFVAEEVGTYAVSVTVTDDEGRTDTDTLYVEVEDYEPPELTVDGPPSVPVGKQRTVTLTATGGEEPLSWVAWQLDGEQLGQEALRGEESETVEAEVTFDEPGTQVVNGTVADERGYQDSDGIAVRVTTPYPYLAVTITSITTPVEAGEPLTVDATVENVGEEATTQPLWLTRDGVVVDHYGSVSLDPDERRDVTFTWQTATGDAGSYEFVAHSVNDTDATEGTVTATGASGSATFTVEYLTTPPEEVLVGETVTPTVRVENTGSVEDTQTVTMLDIHGHPVWSKDLTLGAGEAAELSSLSWTPAAADTGSGDLRVETEDDDARTPLSVVRPAAFEVAIEDTSAFGPSAAADMTATVTVRNTGDLEDTQRIDLGTEDGTDDTSGTLDTRRLTLAGGEQRTVELTWTDAAVALTGSASSPLPEEFYRSPDDATVTVSSADDSDSVTVTPEYLDVEVVGVSEFNVTGNPSEDARVSVRVTNEGRFANTQPITLYTQFDETASASPGVIVSQDVRLDPSESTTIGLTWAGAASVLAENNASAYEATVYAFSQDDYDAVPVKPGTNKSGGGKICPDNLNNFDPDKHSMNCLSSVPDIDDLDLGQVRSRPVDTGEGVNLNLKLTDERLNMDDVGWLEPQNIDPSKVDGKVILENGDEIEIPDDGKIEASKLTDDIKKVEVEMKETVKHDEMDEIDMDNGEDDGHDVGYDIPDYDNGGDNDEEEEEEEEEEEDDDKEDDCRDNPGETCYD